MSESYKKFISWLGTAGSAAIIGSITAGLTTFILNDISDNRSKAREAQYQQIAKLRETQAEIIRKFFSDEDDAVVATSRNYVEAILAKRPLGKPADELSAAISKRVRQSEGLKAIFSGREVDVEIKAYQNALQEFSDSIEEFKNPLLMKRWSEGFNKVQRTQGNLRETLKKISEQTPQLS